MSIAFLKKPLTWMYLGGIILLAVSAWLWCTKLSMDPERVFWGTINHSLAIRGVTIEAEQTSEGAGIHQTLHYSLGANNLSHSRTMLSQQGTEVINEVIGTPKTDYTRYISIKTDQKKADGGKMDFSKVVGQWAVSEPGTNQLFPQAVLGTSLPLGGIGVPMGNLPAAKRAKLVKQMQQDAVYQVDYKKLKKSHQRGRLLYTYEVSIQPVAYAGAMKHFASAVGLGGLDKLDPNEYQGQPALKIQLVVDARARQIVRASVPDTDYVQTYSGYDVPVTADLPKKTITDAELQKRLTELQ